MTRRSSRRAGAAAAIAVLALTLGACGGGDDVDDAIDDTTSTTVTDTPPPTFAAADEAAFLEASKDPQSGKLAELDDNLKLEAGRISCQALKEGLTGREVYEELRKEIDTADVKDEELGFFIGTAVGAMCPEQEEQLKKGFE